MKEKELKYAINILLKHSNIMSPEEDLSKIMHEIVSLEHRTIQQAFIKTINDFLIKYSDTRTDFRNENSVSFAKEVKKLNMNFPFI